MTVSVFISTSLDGFIARPNGDLDFLPAGGGEPHGYNGFIASVDVIVIGRKTFEKVLTFGACTDSLSLVAEDDAVVGHILFTSVVVESAGRRVLGMGLAPMTRLRRAADALGR